MANFHQISLKRSEERGRGSQTDNFATAHKKKLIIFRRRRLHDTSPAARRGPSQKGPSTKLVVPGPCGGYGSVLKQKHLASVHSFTAVHKVRERRLAQLLHGSPSERRQMTPVPRALQLRRMMRLACPSPPRRMSFNDLRRSRSHCKQRLWPSFG